MPRRGRHRHVLRLMPLLVVAVCAHQPLSVTSAFPEASVASPWILEGEVWSGPFADAVSALGPDADEWRPFAPQHVWLAVYRHETNDDRKLTLRAFSFETRQAAAEAYQRFRPRDAHAFRAGDEGCWTEIGVLFVWGRLVFDIFGGQASLQNELEAARLTVFIQKRMPPGLPDAPQ